MVLLTVPATRSVGILLLATSITAFTSTIPSCRTIPKIQQQWSRHRPTQPYRWTTTSQSGLSWRHSTCPFSLTVTNKPNPTATTTAMAFSPSSSSSPSFSNLSFIDIGANVLDERFTHGIYNGKQRHPPDWDAMVQRAQHVGVKAIILTAGTLAESRQALALVRSLRQQQGAQQLQQQQAQSTDFPAMRFGCTIGIHPTRCQQEFLDNEQGLSPEEVLMQLRDLALDGVSDQSVVALGEMGLDYDRLEFCAQDIQVQYFKKQLQVFFSQPALDHLPLFLHNRNVGTDLLQVLQQEQPTVPTVSTSTSGRKRGHGVIHSFDDSLELAQQFIHEGFYIGINGCSLKTEENLKVVEQIPLDKILLETDCPYCEIKNTHAGSKYIQTTWDKKMDKKFEWGKMVKGRNEPCQIIQVAEVIAAVKKVALEEVVQTCYQNSLQFYEWPKIDGI